jgi:hypothetical protein
MATRRDVQAGLARLGARPVAHPSPEFVAGLERHLVGAAARIGAGAPPADLRQRLAWLGDQPVVGPSPEFVAGLERRLVGADRPAGTLVALPARRRPAARVVAAVAAAAVVVLGGAALGGALLGVFSPSASPGHGPLELKKAVNTQVVLPDGRRVTGRSGLRLPNGAVLSTGPNGQASAGSFQLGPGLQGTIDAGRIHLTTPQLPPVTTPTLPSPPPVTTPKVTTPAPRLPPFTLPPVTLPVLPPVTLPHLLPH